MRSASLLVALLAASSEAGVLVPIQRDFGWTGQHTENVMEFVNTALIQISQGESPTDVLNAVATSPWSSTELTAAVGKAECPKTTDWDTKGGQCKPVCDCMASELLYGITQSMPYTKK